MISVTHQWFSEFQQKNKNLEADEQFQRRLDQPNLFELANC